MEADCSATARVWGLLCAWPDRAWRMAALTREAGVSKAAVWRAFDWLEEKGLLRVKEDYE